MNFKVMEKTSTFWDEKPRFQKLYNDGASMKKILETCHLTGTQYNKLVRECSQEGLITPRRKKHLGEI